MFRDRVDAGIQLAHALTQLRPHAPIVLGLPRGGVIVAAEVARALAAPLDVLVVRKLGAPGHEEFGFGAIGSGVEFVNRAAVRSLRLSPGEVAAVKDRERRELERRIGRYRRGRPAPDLAGRTVIVVDDGIATGSSAIAACQVAHAQGAGGIILAVPISPAQWNPPAAAHVDELVTVATTPWLGAIGQWYADFTQVTDEEVVDALVGAG